MRLGCIIHCNHAAYYFYGDGFFDGKAGMNSGKAPSDGQFFYGRDTLQIPELFSSAPVLAPPAVAGIADIAGELWDKLENPVGAPPLREFVREGDHVTLVVSDLTRPASTKEMLPVILEEISHAGEVRILVALGLHRRLEDEELKKLLGWKVANALPVYQHDCHSDGRLIFLGRTRYGTEVSLSRFLLPEDVYRSEVDKDKAAPVKVVVTGTISPHYFYGFSGGRKSILPGCASEKSIKQNHSLILGPEGERLKECRAGHLAGNPCHLDSLEATGMLGDIFCINTIHCGPAGTATVVAGGLNEAHIQGCRYYIENCSAELDSPCDVVLASCGGYPRDINFIQSHKSLEYAFGALKPGGTLILAAECAEGYGSDRFFPWFRFSSLPEFYEALQENYQVYGQTAYSTLWKAKKADILLVSSLKPEEVSQMSMTPVKDLAEAAQFVKGKHGGSFDACIMPFAGDTLIGDDALAV